MAVFEFSAVIKKREDSVERGTVVADTEQEARNKLKKLDYDSIRLRRLRGFAGFFKALTADIK